MKINKYLQSQVINLKEPYLLEGYKISGKVTSGALSLLKDNIFNDLSLLKLNTLAEEFIKDNKCAPTFKGYHGFPSGVCISVNKQMVHGIPTDYHLQDGDVVTFDLGSTYKFNNIECITDSAITLTVNNSKHTKLVNSCYEALFKGIDAVKIGNKIGAIGNAIYKSAKGNGFNVVPQYGGHGICFDKNGNGIPHAPPFVPNKSSPHEGITIQEGMVLAIEPILTFGSTTTRVSDDGWTVIGEDVSAHFEHSIFVTKNSIEILTR